MLHMSAQAGEGARGPGHHLSLSAGTEIAVCGLPDPPLLLPAAAPQYVSGTSSSSSSHSTAVGGQLLLLPGIMLAPWTLMDARWGGGARALPLALSACARLGRLLLRLLELPAAACCCCCCCWAWSSKRRAVVGGLGWECGRGALDEGGLQWWQQQQVGDAWSNPCLVKPCLLIESPTAPAPKT